MAANTNKSILIVIVFALIAFSIYSFLTLPDNRSPTEKLGDTIHDLPQGVDKASRQLENRTPGEKIGDAIKDTGNDIKRNTGASQ